jgi:hypothetical protein
VTIRYTVRTDRQAVTGTIGVDEEGVSDAKVAPCIIASIRLAGFGLCRPFLPIGAGAQGRPMECVKSSLGSGQKSTSYGQEKATLAQLLGQRSDWFCACCKHKFLSIGKTGKFCRWQGPCSILFLRDERAPVTRQKEYVVVEKLEKKTEKLDFLCRS